VTEQDLLEQLSKEKEAAVARATYNFVPFSETVLYRYGGVEEIPSLLGLDPKLKSGEIHYTLRACTPVFCGGWLGRTGEKRDELPFYRTEEGKCALPASTVRGHIRANMSILTFGRAKTSDQRFRYSQLHRPKEGKLRYAPALRYWEVLGIEDRAQRESGEEQPKIFVPRNVHSGYLRKEKGKFFIRPAKREAYRLSPTHPLLNAAFPPEEGERGRWYGLKILPVYYGDKDGKLTRLQREAAPELKRGCLLRFYEKTSYLFAEEDPKGERIFLSPTLIRIHERSGFRMPKGGEALPVFFIRYREAGEKEDRIYFGQKRFLNIGFRYAMDAGIPPAHRQDKEKVDYTDGIFGRLHCTSRISFEDCVLEGEPNWASPVRKPLCAPQPAYYPNYVEDGKSYNDPGFRLRGYKQYWLKDPKPESEEKEGEKKGRRPFTPLAEGSRFSGVIRFRNLHPDELGALLWALRLDDGCYQSIGRGRSAGYGRMKAEIRRLVTYDVKAHYADLLPARREETDGVRDYIRVCIDEAEKRLPGARGLRERPEIRDFLYIRSRICDGEQVESMNREMCRDVREPLPTIRQIREGEAEFC